MADYYPLIARAIAGLDPNAPGESRRALYERARAALIQQLRSVQPPLSESEITRERLSLEEAVRKVESEAAQRAREASRPGGGAAARGGDAFRRANTRPPEASGPPGSSNTARPRPAAPEPRPPRNLRGDAPPPAPPPRAPAPQAPAADPQLPPTRERSGAPRRGPAPPPAPGLTGFRDIAADADELGRAAAQASRNARKTYANVPSPSPEFDRLEPSLENRGADPDVPYSYDESLEEAERYNPQAAPPSAPPQRSRISTAPSEPTKRVRTGSAFPFKSIIALGIVLILVGAGFVWGKQVVGLVNGLLKSQPSTVEAPANPAQPATKPKIADRVGQPSSDPIAPVAQRVVLYDEDPSDPKGKQFVGTVVWRTEPIKATGNQKADIAVRADIDIPDRKFKMTISFVRNTDASLPASHTMELGFLMPQDANGGVGNVPGVLMKSNEQARGTPLAGYSVKVTDGTKALFLVGLSNVDADRQRNLQLLKERSWFDVPLVYANQRRAIIAVEKGAPGERAFNEAFAAWGE
ncbi:hypothetical protein JQ604_18870 [Bradyrhizobium jicamae]|uniref:hypothetical protein n=1 Tax=Bradyrhizobium jicamae TaxID=280332 RepID=UPI001BA4A3E1|nr:hypothetical protein [Bradyrhizobium jicamae]MBR0754252.1 hypothetical protein [Bradyrhizobium jicamae]